MDPVSPQTIALVVIANGSDARIEGDVLYIFPKNTDGGPIAFPIPLDGFGRRIVIQIAKRCAILPHEFWHPPVPTSAQRAPAKKSSKKTS